MKDNRLFKVTYAVTTSTKYIGTFTNILTAEEVDFMKADYYHYDILKIEIVFAIY